MKVYFLRHFKRDLTTHKDYKNLVFVCKKFKIEIPLIFWRKKCDCGHCQKVMRG
jgi:hypothetical protein